MMPPTAPTASVPPMVRENMWLAVATPRWRHSTLVCTASISAVLAKPSPAP
jgi:hypothetical protein